MRSLSTIILCSLSLCSAVSLCGQSVDKIKLIRADVIEYDESLVRAQRLLGRVIFEHDGSRMHCDSAYLYESSNRFESFGNVRITDAENLSIRGQRLDYNGDEGIARIYEDITLRDGEMTLTTDYIEYELEERKASYFNGGRIVSNTNQNTLTSERGFYFAESKVMHFKDSVELNNPRYTMYTDTLHYHSYSEQAFFLGPTDIISDENRIYCENGWYDTQNEKAQFGDGAHMWSDEQQLIGDSIYYDRGSGYGEAFGEVSIVDTLNDLRIYGDYGRHLELQNESFVTESARMDQYFKQDTLVVLADTLLMLSDTLGFRNISAFYNVRMHKSDFQGRCDSLVYAEADSLLTLYTEPVIWSGENQISGEYIELRTYEGKIKQLYTENMAFIISEVDTTHYNQIKGRELTGHFSDNELIRVNIVGNGEVIYFAVDDEGDGDVESRSIQDIIGVNKGTSSNLVIGIKDKEVNEVRFINEPENAFYPLDKIDSGGLFLKDFKWSGAERPKRPVSLPPLLSAGVTYRSY